MTHKENEFYSQKRTDFYGGLNFPYYNATTDIQKNCVRYTEWYGKPTCAGRVIRDICNFGIQDLPRLSLSRCLIANKFNIDVDPLAIFCHVKNIWKMQNSTERVYQE